MPKPIVCLSAALRQFSEAFCPCFSKRQWKYFVIVLLGMVECKGRRTLRGLLACVGEKVSLCGLSRFFNRWQWRCEDVAQVWLRRFREHLATLWAEADEREKGAILGSLFVRIYVNLDEGRVTALEPAPAFAPWLAQTLTSLAGGLLDPGPWHPPKVAPRRRSKYTGPLARAMQRLGRGEKYRDLAPDERAAYAEYRRERRDEKTRERERRENA